MPSFGNKSINGYSGCSSYKHFECLFQPDNPILIALHYIIFTSLDTYYSYRIANSKHDKKVPKIDKSSNSSQIVKMVDDY